jgi:hypothetical protein
MFRRKKFSSNGFTDKVLKNVSKVISRSPYSSSNINSKKKPKKILLEKGLKNLKNFNSLPKILNFQSAKINEKKNTLSNPKISNQYS